VVVVVVVVRQGNESKRSCFSPRVSSLSRNFWWWMRKEKVREKDHRGVVGGF